MTKNIVHGDVTFFCYKFSNDSAEQWKLVFQAPSEFLILFIWKQKNKEKNFWKSSNQFLSFNLSFCTLFRIDFGEKLCTSAIA